MDKCIITFRSVTPAQRGELVLRQEGITCSLQRTPKALAERGCGYSLLLQCRHLYQAAELLRKNGIAFRKAYRLGEGGKQEELAL